MAIHEWSRMQEPKFLQKQFLNLRQDGTLYQRARAL
jgi:hypothetical protein